LPRAHLAEDEYRKEKEDYHVDGEHVARVLDVVSVKRDFGVSGREVSDSPREFVIVSVGISNT
jgi:hypothetical protein